MKASAERGPRGLGDMSQKQDLGFQNTAEVFGGLLAGDRGWDRNTGCPGGTG